MLDFSLMAILFKQILQLQINFCIYVDQNVMIYYSVSVVNGSPS